MTKPNKPPKTIKQFRVKPVTKKNWNKFIELFGNKGACANCWCMYYRLSKVEFEKGKVDDENKRRIKEIIFSDRPVGTILPGAGRPYIRFYRV